ncbi:MAG: YkgJ family cysteine cluster protein [Proteobacteria bacterium]|nr:YkgJ family cysteine cluster protein [Pseudomonadota bacterium]
MKSTILHTMYDIFSDWSHHLPVVCNRGCSACCTENVTITATEGEEILRFAAVESLAPWLAEKLARPRTHQSVEMTTNDFAGACLEGREIDQDDIHTTLPCPFLEENSCRIYPARPFGCRVFISTKRCSSIQPALVPDYYFEAATAVNQLVEHLGQREYWGNMLDVLPALLDINEFREIGTLLDQTLIIEARLRTLTAKPLPGFLVSEKNNGQVTQLLETIFSADVEGKRLGDILNGH